ncbi:MAG TPA: GNAT family N-acetyltransferase, partial [Allosphingosinicella sp.]|nr:GNAT family N-acetyltransferase [Allosphingosinicella sp.]
HGKYGLEDAKTGKEVFGFGKSGLTATPGEIEDFLRGDAAATWKSSVGKAPARKAKPKPAPKPRPEPKLVIREARPGDAEPAAALIRALGYEVSAADVRKRLASLKKAGDAALAAVRGELIGLVTLHVTPVLHRPRPVGRITLLVVAEDMRGKGVGAALVAAAEHRLAAKGCGLVEVTSNRKRLRAHAFYERLGYERTSYRFARSLAD